MATRTYSDSWIGDWSLTIKNLVFPIFCRECGVRLQTEENPSFCPMCWELSARIERPFCVKCGVPQQGRAGFGEPYNFTCAECRENPLPYVRRVYAAAAYEGAVAQAIQLFKFYDKRPLAPHLGTLLQQFAVVEMDREQYDGIVPVPLHRVRQRDRGFNQSSLLAESAAEIFPNAPVRNALLRIRPTAVQSRIRDSEARATNVLDAFAVPKDESVTNQTLLIVDDVVTTGSTVSECARTLLEAGAAAVDVLAVAVPVDQDMLLDDLPK